MDNGENNLWVRTVPAQSNGYAPFCTLVSALPRDWPGQNKGQARESYQKLLIFIATCKNEGDPPLEHFVLGATGWTFGFGHPLADMNSVKDLALYLDGGYEKEDHEFAEECGVLNISVQQVCSDALDSYAALSNGREYGIGVVSTIFEIENTFETLPPLLDITPFESGINERGVEPLDDIKYVLSHEF